MAIQMKLKKNASFGIVSAVFLLLFVNGISAKLTAASDSPFIVAHKTVTLSKLDSKAERVSVVIDIYNRGSATAYDVSLTDNSWSKDVFDSVAGNTSRSWEKLDAGSVVSHSFVLKSRVKTDYHGAPALIKYRVPKEAALKEAYSTSVLPLEVLAERTHQKFELAKSLLTTHGSKVAVVSIIALFVHLITTPPKSSKKKH